MDVPSRLTLFDCSANRNVIAHLSPLTREAAKNGVSPWWDGLSGLLGDPEDEPDSEWDWVYLISVGVQNKPLRRGVSVTTSNGVIQGAMLYRLNAKSVLEPEKGAVFVDRIATAPHNRGELVANPRYRGVGEGLLAYAIAESIAYGLDGRVILFPIAANDFYVKRGFVPTEEKTEDGDILHELPAAEAKRLLQERGAL